MSIKNVEDIARYENEGGTPTPDKEEYVTLELLRSDAEHLFSVAMLKSAIADVRILDAFRRALANGAHTSRHS